MHPLPRALAALALVALGVLGAGQAAAADETDCVSTFYDTGGRELFDVDDPYVPPALRGFTPDCTSRLAAEPFGTGVTPDFAYNAVWVDIEWDEAVAILRALEDGGYTGVIDQVDLAGGGVEQTSLTSAQLAAVDPVQLAGGVYSDNTPLPDGGFRTETFTVRYADGATYQNDAAWTTPTLVVGIISTAPYDATGLDDPSVLSGLHPFVTPTPVQVGVIAGGALILTLVVGWPAALLNSVVGSRYDGLVRWLTRRRRRGGAGGERDADAAPPRRRLPGWLMWPGFALAAILGAFVDPDFGWNAMSVRVVVTLFLSFVLFNLATWALVRRLARRIQPDSEPLLRFRWGTLALVALAVLVARLLQLEPGVIFGLVAGVAYATALRAMQSAVIALLGAGVGLVLALVAWTGYTLLSPVAAGSSDSVPLILLTEFLAGVTIKGVSSLPLALLPLGSLDGAKVLKWRRVVWAVAYAVGLAAFMLVLLTIPKAWGEVPGDFVRWLVLFGVYALVAVAVWIINTVLVRRRPPTDTPIGEQPDAITID